MNRRSRSRLAFIPLALAFAIALPETVLAATVSDTYTIRGAEYYATSTQGRFGGTASGNTGDSATWQATVNHATDRRGHDHRWHGAPRDVTTGRPPGPVLRRRCDAGQSGGGLRHETFAVEGTLVDVTRTDSSAVGTGMFSATLTHYRASLFGTCRTISATVRGTISLDF